MYFFLRNFKNFKEETFEIYIHRLNSGLILNCDMFDKIQTILCIYLDIINRRIDKVERFLIINIRKKKNI